MFRLSGRIESLFASCFYLHKCSLPPEFHWKLQHSSSQGASIAIKPFTRKWFVCCGLHRIALCELGREQQISKRLLIANHSPHRVGHNKWQETADQQPLTQLHFKHLWCKLSHLGRLKEIQRKKGSQSLLSDKTQNPRLPQYLLWQNSIY